MSVALETKAGGPVGSDRSGRPPPVGLVHGVVNSVVWPALMRGGGGGPRCGGGSGAGRGGGPAAALAGGVGVTPARAVRYNKFRA